MALYHAKAEKLKPRFQAMHFTREQLELIHTAMRQCASLRQTKVITSFFELMLPEEFELRYGSPVTKMKRNRETYQYIPVFVRTKGDELPLNALPDEPEENSD